MSPDFDAAAGRHHPAQEHEGENCLPRWFQDDVNLHFETSTLFFNRHARNVVNFGIKISLTTVISNKLCTQ